MKRDVTQLPSDGECIAIIDDKTLQVYTPTNTLETYKLISDKYFLISTDTVSETPPRTQCYTIEQIDDLPSQFEFVEPFLHNMAIISALFIFWVAYRLILFPFFRKKI
jgi:hypothetical protein